MSDLSREENIFLAAAGRTDPAERVAYLDQACLGDVELRRQVDELLAASPKIGQFLEPSDDATKAYQTVIADGVDTVAGTVIASWNKLLELIGEGGMGEVWVANQLEPIKRPNRGCRRARPACTGRHA